MFDHFHVSLAMVSYVIVDIRFLQVLHGQLDSMSVLKTIVDIPGVQPGSLIELFSARLVSALGEVGIPDRHIHLHISILCIDDTRDYFTRR